MMGGSSPRRLIRTAARAALLVAIGVFVNGIAPDAAGAASARSAEIVRPGGVIPLTSGGSATPFGLAIPEGAACPGDSAHDGYYVDSYVVPATSDPGRIYFPGEIATVGTQLVTLSGEPYTAQTTAEYSGDVVLPPPFSWSQYANDPKTLPPGTYNVGLICVNRHGHPAIYWNTRVTFRASPADPGGFTWSVPSSPATSGSSSAVPIAAAGAAIALIVLAGGFLLVRSRRGSKVPPISV
jgi:hypothetical protein